MLKFDVLPYVDRAESRLLDPLEVFDILPIEDVFTDLDFICMPFLFFILPLKVRLPILFFMCLCCLLPLPLMIL